jgi:ADP-dependent NAD(P)H-hydrate dehydratase
LARANKRPVAVTSSLLRRWPLPTPGADADKTDRGVALVVGGAAEIPGALLLAGTAALRVGAGKLRLAAPRVAAAALGVAVPEARVFALPENGDGFLDRKSARRASACTRNVDSILVGPGMLDENATREFVQEFLPAVADRPLVIDAVALSALGDQRDHFADTASTILTPNIDEMARIVGDGKATIEKDPAGAALTLARQVNAVVVLKGSETYIATPDAEVFRYSEGKVGLATSGSGDVLAGAMVGLLAREASPDQAAVWAVYLHGTAGNRLQRKIGSIGFLARELCDEIAPVINSLSARRR